MTNAGKNNSRRDRGFTLIELMVVVAIIGILVSVSIPTYKTVILRAREAVLRQNLYYLRDAIDQYYADKQKYPDSLDDLVSAGYFRKLPLDPITGKADWVTVDFSGAEEGQLEPTESQDTGGIWDVHCPVEKYADW